MGGNCDNNKEQRVWPGFSTHQPANCRPFGFASKWTNRQHRWSKHVPPKGSTTEPGVHPSKGSLKGTVLSRNIKRYNSCGFFRPDQLGFIPLLCGRSNCESRLFWAWISFEFHEPQLSFTGWNQQLHWGKRWRTCWRQRACSTTAQVNPKDGLCIGFLLWGSL